MYYFKFLKEQNYPIEKKLKNMVEIKEIFREQPPARNLSATVRRVLQCTNVTNQRPPFWFDLKSTNPAV